MRFTESCCLVDGSLEERARRYDDSPREGLTEGKLVVVDAAVKEAVDGAEVLGVVGVEAVEGAVGVAIGLSVALAVAMTGEDSFEGVAATLMAW